MSLGENDLASCTAMKVEQSLEFTRFSPKRQLPRVEAETKRRLSKNSDGRKPTSITAKLLILPATVNRNG